jgi:hypothetical protein
MPEAEGIAWHQNQHIVTFEFFKNYYTWWVPTRYHGKFLKKEVM